MNSNNLQLLNNFILLSFITTINDINIFIITHVLIKFKVLSLVIFTVHSLLGAFGFVTKRSF